MFDLFPDTKWYTWIWLAPLFILWLIFANLIAVPHWIMGKPDWYKKFLITFIGQGWYIKSIFKEDK